jgi:membrane glycosyltransferase
MSPILAGLIFSIPLSFLTGSSWLGHVFRQCRIFQTVEENHPPPELVQLAAAQTVREEETHPLPIALRANYGLLQAVLDPYVNAVHVSLLRAKDAPPPKTKERFISLRATLLQEGPRALTANDRLAVLMDADSMHALHYELWSTPSSSLGEWWQLALKYYTRLAPAPKTAFSANFSVAARADSCKRRFGDLVDRA